MAGGHGASTGADERLQQHDRQQRLDPRGRRHRARRRAERPRLQQHDHEERDDRDGRDERRPAGPGRACRPRPTATCSRPPLPGGLADLQQPAPVQQHLLGQPGRHPRPGRGRASVPPATPRRSTAGTSASRRLRDRWHRPTRSSSRTRAIHPYTTSATNSAPIRSSSTPYDVSVAFAPWRTNPNFVGAILVAADAAAERCSVTTT